MTKQVIFKGNNLWLKAEVVKIRVATYSTAVLEFFVKAEKVKEVAA